MKQLKKNYDEKLHYKLRNASGGDLDLTSKTVSWTLTEFNGNTVITKDNTLGGGSDSEIKVIDAEAGIIVVFVLNEDTKNLNDVNYQASVLVDGDSIETESILFYPSVSENKVIKYYPHYGTSEDRPSLPASQYIGFRYWEIDNDRNVYWTGSAWDVKTEHEQNKDSYLDLGGGNEVSAEDIKNVLDNFVGDILNINSIGDFSIDESKLKDNSVVTEKIANLNVTLPKLSQAVLDYINGSGGGTITNNPDDITLETKAGSTIGMKTNLILLEWVKGENFQLLSITRDSLGVITSATVKFPDGATGNLTMTNYNSTFLTYDGFNITHSISSKTITQGAVTRNSLGAVITVPQLVLS